MSREQIARNQRARSYGAMIESTARRGYRKTTVGDVIALAGISRRAFYEHFSDKGACFQATHNSIVGRMRKRAIDGWNSQHGWTSRLHAACGRVFEGMSERPNDAHLILVDSLAVPPGALERLQLTTLTFERLFVLALSTQTKHRGICCLPSPAFVGGVRHVAFAHVRERREIEVDTLADDVLDWVEAYRLPITRRRLFQPRRVTKTPQKPAAFLTGRHPEARIFAAMATLTREVGYLAVNDSILAKRARLPTQGLHKCFTSKEAVLLALVDSFINEGLEQVRDEIRDAVSWPAGVHRAINAYTQHLAAHESLSRLAFIDLFQAGQPTIEHLTRTVDGLVLLLTENGPSMNRQSGVALSAIRGAIWANLLGTIVGRDTAKLPAVVDQLAFIVLAPYIGADEAVTEILTTHRRQKGKRTDRQSTS